MMMMINHRQAARGGGRRRRVNTDRQDAGELVLMNLAIVMQNAPLATHGDTEFRSNKGRDGAAPSGRAARERIVRFLPEPLVTRRVL